MQICLLLVVASIAGLVAFWMRDRKRFTDRLGSLSDRHRELEAVLNGFMEEAEKITVQFSRLIPVNRPAAAAAIETAAPSPDAKDAETSRTKTTGLEKRHIVLGLAQKGRSIPEIAERLMIPRGEVELILNLNQSKRAAAGSS